MKIAEWEKWLVNEQWNGHPLGLMMSDAVVGGAGLKVRALRSLFIITNGLNGEAGEATEHFKKWVRDGKMNKREAGIELGDALAYLTWLAATLGYTLDDIAGLNHEKLTARGKKA